MEQKHENKEHVFAFHNNNPLKSAFQAHFLEKNHTGGEFDFDMFHVSSESWIQP